MWILWMMWYLGWMDFLHTQNIECAPLSRAIAAVGAKCTKWLNAKYERDDNGCCSVAIKRFEAICAMRFANFVHCSMKMLSHNWWLRLWMAIWRWYAGAMYANQYHHLENAHSFNHKVSKCFWSSVFSFYLNTNITHSMIKKQNRTKLERLAKSSKLSTILV